MKVKKQLLLTTILVALTGSLMVAGSFAWFAKTDRLITDDSENGIQGEIIKSYFHSGTGTKEDPLTITTRWHYENFIKLHYQVENFGEHSYYFQLGATENDGMPAGTTTPMFYAVDGNGVVQADKTSNILNLQGEILPPLGTDNKPFKAHLDGSGLTVENFTVGGNHFYDIGIFGFVDVPNDMKEIVPSIKNVYFNNFEIDTTAASDLLEHTETDIIKRPHYEEGEDNNASVGYIAGHITYSALCEHVYANNCTIEKNDNNDSDLAANEKYVDVKDNYGYFGKTEFDTNTGIGGVGSNYKFVLDSGAVFNYMNQNYRDISSYPMRNRNTEYAGNYPNPEFDSKNNTINKFEKGVRYVPQGLPSYNFIGDDPDDYSTSDPYSGLNYSLSTIGYVPLDDQSKSYRYQVKTADGITPSKDMIFSTESLKTAKDYKGGTIKEERRYYNATTNKWEYYNLDLYDRGKVPVTINMSCNGTYTRSLSGLTDSTDYWSSYTQAYLFIDGEIVKQYSASDFDTFSITTESYSVPLLGTRYRNPTYTIKFNKTYDTSLYMGTHHIALFIKCCCGNGQYATQYFYDAGSSVSVSSALAIPANRATITEGTLTIDTNTHDNDVIKISINPNSNNGYLNASRHMENDRVIAKSGETWNDDNRTIIDSSSAQSVELVGYDLNNPKDTSAHSLSSDGFDFEYDDGKAKKTFMLKYDGSGNIQYDPDNGLPFGVDEEGNTIKPDGDTEVVYELGIAVAIRKTVQDHDSMWIAKMETTKNIRSHSIVDADNNMICDACNQKYEEGETSHSDAPIYIADDPILTESGYSADNIDIVGGGFQFSNQFVTIDGEDNRALTSPLTASDVGKKWYATQHAANSIVLYLSNVGGMDDHDFMGNIKFHYSWTLAPITGVDFKSMVFKKGGRNDGYVYMNNSLAMETGDFIEEAEGNLNNRIEMVLRRGIVKKCAYAALDKDGNILCGYDSNGKQIANTGTIKESEIRTYVLLVGVKNNLTWLQINTRISKIEFEYKAPKGFGGSFGSIEFRSANQQVDSTIFNFYFLVPKGDKYRVTVSYAGPDAPSGENKGRYEVTFYYYSSASSETKLKVLFYLYDIANYEVYCNGNQVADNGNGEVDLGSTDPATWPSNNNT